MIELTGKQRRFLRAAANRLDPAVMVGQKGLTDNLFAKVEEALSAHELIKIKFIDFKDEKKTLTEEILQKTDSVLAGMIGHIAIVFRPHPEEEKRVIKLP